MQVGSGIDCPSGKGGVVISKATLRTHDRDPEYCLLTEETNCIRKNSNSGTLYV